MIIEQFYLAVDFNGIVIFSCPDLDRWYGGIANGQNILKDFIETDVGDKVMDEGLVVPLVNMDDGDYLIRIFDERPLKPDVDVVFSEYGYPLKVSHSVYCADVAVFWDWEKSLGWRALNILPGFYSVDIIGVRHPQDDGSYIPGYDFIFNKSTSLPKRTAKTRLDSRVS